MHITIPGQPFGWQRPGVNTRGKFAVLYTRPETKRWEAATITLIRSHWKRAPLSVPVEVRIEAVQRRPQSFPKRDPDRRWCGAKPDVDNVAKAVLDALVGAHVLKDDNLVVKLDVRHVYAALGEMPSLTIEVVEAPPRPLLRLAPHPTA